MLRIIESMTTDFLAAEARPTPRDQQIARVAEERLRQLLEVEAPAVSLELRFREKGEEKVELVALPSSVLRGLDTLLEAHASGTPVSVVPSRQELTPNQAAEVLGVSRPFLVKLLDEGKIPFRRVGAHRRVRLDALHAYLQHEEERQLEVMARLQAQAQELRMGY